MIAAIKMAMKYADVLPLAVDLIEAIHAAIGDDGKMTKKEQSKLLKKFWAIVKEIKEKE